MDDIIKRLRHIIFHLLIVQNVDANVVSVCKYNDSQQSSTKTDLKTTVFMNSKAVINFGVSTNINHNDINLVRFESVFTSLMSPDINIIRSVQISHFNQSLPVFLLSTSLTLSSGSNLSSVSFLEDIHNGLQGCWSSTFIPGLSVPGVTVDGRQQVIYLVPYDVAIFTAPGDTKTLQFQAKPSGEGDGNLQPGMTNLTSQLNFTDTSSGTVFGPIWLPVCLNIAHRRVTMIRYQRGFAALTFVVAFFVGCFLVGVGVFFYFRTTSWHQAQHSVLPSHLTKGQLNTDVKKIIIDPKVALRKNFNVIRDNSTTAWNDSIVYILSIRNKRQMLREIDNLDVMVTTHVECDLETEQNEASVHAAFLLIHSLYVNGDITKATEDNALKTFNGRWKEMRKKLDDEFKMEMEVVFNDISVYNKGKVAELFQKQSDEKLVTLTSSRNLFPLDQGCLIQLIDEQQEIEKDDVIFILTLEQNERAENIRKQYAMRTRVGLTGLQHSLLHDLIAQCRLTETQVDWLIQEHREQLSVVGRLYDEETLRQRAVLEEKNRLLSVKLLSDQWNDGEVNLKSREIMRNMEKRVKNEAVKLNGKLSVAKVSQLDDMMARHKLEVGDFLRKTEAEKSKGAVDPISYTECMLKLRSQHRVDLSRLENLLDVDHCQQLLSFSRDASDDAMSEMNKMEGDIVEMLGAQEKSIALSTRKYTKEKQHLQNLRDKNRRENGHILEEMMVGRRKLYHGHDLQKDELDAIRQQESEVIIQLLNGQLSMSESEREQIMMEHKRLFFLLENSILTPFNLTLNKLRQLRSLEGRRIEIRSELLKKLQSKQYLEIMRHRKVAENNGEDEDVETHLAELELRKKHVTQCLETAKGDTLNVGETLEEMQGEMTKKRMTALREHEERLGAMIVATQLEQVKETVNLEMSQTAINMLSVCLMDNMIGRGISSTLDCQHILDVHKQETEHLLRMLELQERKEERIQRERFLSQQQDDVMLAKLGAESKQSFPGGNVFSQSLRQLHNYLVDRFRFRYSLGREKSQLLAENGRICQATKLQRMHNLELAFVAEQIKTGGFHEGEIFDALCILLPGKPESAIRHDFHTLFEAAQENPRQDNVANRLDKGNTLVDRIYHLHSSWIFPEDMGNSLQSEGNPIRMKNVSGKQLNVTRHPVTVLRSASDNTSHKSTPVKTSQGTTASLVKGNNSGQQFPFPPYDVPLQKQALCHHNNNTDIHDSHRITEGTVRWESNHNSSNSRHGLVGLGESMSRSGQPLPAGSELVSVAAGTTQRKKHKKWLIKHKAGPQ